MVQGKRSKKETLRVKEIEMIRFLEDEDRFNEAKDVAIEIVANLPDDYEIAIQAVEMAFIAVLREKHNPIDILTALVVKENWDEIERVIRAKQK